MLYLICLYREKNNRKAYKNVLYNIVLVDVHIFCIVVCV